MILLNPRKPGKVIQREYRCKLCERSYPLNYTAQRPLPDGTRQGTMKMSRLGGMTLLGMVCSRCRLECRAIRAKWTR